MAHFSRLSDHDIEDHRYGNERCSPDLRCSLLSYLLLRQFAWHRLSRENKDDIKSNTPPLWPHLTRLSPITKPTTNLHNLIADFHQLIGTDQSLVSQL